MIRLLIAILLLCPVVVQAQGVSNAAVHVSYYDSTLGKRIVKQVMLREGFSFDRDSIWVVVSGSDSVGVAYKAYRDGSGNVITSTYQIALSSVQNRLWGRGASSGTGAPEAITLGTGLSLSGTTLNGTAALSSVQNRLWGRGNSSGTGAPEAITLGTGLYLSGTTMAWNGLSVAEMDGDEMAPTINYTATRTSLAFNAEHFTVEDHPSSSILPFVSLKSGGGGGAQILFYSHYSRRWDDPPVEVGDTVHLVVTAGYREGGPASWYMTYNAVTITLGEMYQEYGSGFHTTIALNATFVVEGTGDDDVVRITDSASGNEIDHAHWSMIIKRP